MECPLFLRGIADNRIAVPDDPDMWSFQKDTIWSNLAKDTFWLSGIHSGKLLHSSNQSVIFLL